MRLFKRKIGGTQEELQRSNNRQPSRRLSPFRRVISWGVWTGTHKHWYIYDKYNPYPSCCERYWQFLGQKDESVNLGDPPPPPDQCQNQDPPCASPIIISLGKRADITLTSVEDGVWFDIDGDGIIDHVAWTREGSDDGFLVFDRNGNGVIDDGHELFGTVTLRSDGTTAINGFNALLDIDGGAEHSNGRIDEDDPVYETLKMWIDRNHNGISEPDELVSLRGAGVRAILTGYRTAVMKTAMATCLPSPARPSSRDAV